jgi:uncharacterized protein with GYD domain
MPLAAHQPAATSDWEESMPLFITRSNYTREAIAGMTAKPEDRTDAVAKLLGAVGGKLHGYYMTFGEYDFLLVGEAPNEKDILAAVIVAAGSGGVTNVNTTLAVTSADAKAAFAKANSLAAQFRAAGR